MRWGRGVLFCLGLAMTTYAAWLLVSAGDLVAVMTWLAAGVVAHDAVLAPIVLGLGLAGRALPASTQRTALVAAVIAGSASLIAVPVVGGFGAKDDNPTLLDRGYLATLVTLWGVALLAVAFAWWRERSIGRSED